ncbi:hypothetical protein Tco_0526625 [Tanacetum coccineum]
MQEESCSWDVGDPEQRHIDTRHVPRQNDFKIQTNFKDKYATTNASPENNDLALNVELIFFEADGCDSSISDVDEGPPLHRTMFHDKEISLAEYPIYFKSGHHMTPENSLRVQVDSNMYSGVQSRIANKPDMVVNDSVTSELARYKEMVGDCEPYNAKDVTDLIEQNDCVRIELEKVKQHYKELYDSIKITRAHTSEKTSTMLNEIESLKAQLRSKESCFTSDYVKPKVLAPGQVDRSYLWYLDSSGCSKHMTGETFKAQELCEMFIGCDHKSKLLEGLAHKLFSGRQFLDLIWKLPQKATLAYVFHDINVADILSSFQVNHVVASSIKTIKLRSQSMILHRKDPG